MPDKDLQTKLNRPTRYVAAKSFADVVMKGGITSGIVFPLAICELASKFRFRNIGGTSAGAIAAGLAAAAEYGRRTGHPEGFAKLAQLPMWLGGRDEGRRYGNMLGLFQPQPSTRPLFELLLLFLKPSAPLVLAVRGLRTALFDIGILPWLGLAPGLALAVSLAFADSPASTVALAIAATLWLTAAVIGLGLLSVPIQPHKRKVVLGIGAGIAVLLIVIGPPILARLIGTPLSVVGAAWAHEGALLLAALGLLAGCVTAVVRKLLKDVPSNGFGICSGKTVGADKGPPALTPWLHQQIQELAGRKPTDPPLTFHDLEFGNDEEQLRFRAMTTCLTKGRPYLLPFETKIFYFDEDEMAKLFPSDVVKSMVDAATSWRRREKPEKGHTPAADDAKDPDPFHFPEDVDYVTNRYMHPRLPLPLYRLPIVVAVRMSLSFPLLLSAVPLWAIDWRKEENRTPDRLWKSWCVKGNATWMKLRTHPEKALRADPKKKEPPKDMPRAEVCWFSDGGICSNFPVHLFDQLLPRWPTFGINLKYSDVAKQRDSRVELASNHTSGLLEPWESLSNLSKFLGAIFGTMQNWTDNSMLKVPGYRDRIVHLHLAHEEGGMNLDMTPEQIGDLARWGREAGEALAERFTTQRAEKSELSWDNHRWARLRSSLAFLQEELEAVAVSYREPGHDGWRSYPELIDREAGEHPTSYPWQWVSQKPLAKEALDCFGKLVDLLNQEEGQPGFLDARRPKPLPRFHIRPPLQK